MAHPMYGIDALLKKYPLAGKAFARAEAEIEAVFFPLGGEEASINAPKLIIEAIDQNVPGADAEKEALIIGAFYLIAPEAAAEDAPKLDAEYGAQAAAIREILAGAKTSYAALKQPVPEKISRISIALGVASMQCLISTLAEGGPEITMPAEAVAQMKAQMTAGEKELLPALNAPQLEALHQKTRQNLFDTLDRAAAPAKKNGKKPDGPKI